MWLENWMQAYGERFVKGYSIPFKGIDLVDGALED
jgi:hypothetical protein